MASLYIVMHNASEDGVLVDSWGAEHGFKVCRVRLYLGAELPEPEAGDGVIVLGGAMGIYDEDQYTWLRREKEWLRELVAAGTPVLGICLGAQLLCAALGGRVETGAAREIGFSDIRRLDTAVTASPLGDLPEIFRAFQWHSDRCVLPPEVELLAESEFCGVQAFSYGSRVLGIQFHLDYDARLVNYNLEHFSDALEVTEGYIQSREQVLSEFEQLEITGKYFTLLLDKILL